MGPMIQQTRAICEACQGQGQKSDDKFSCKACNGKKVLPEEKTLEIVIEKRNEKWSNYKI